MSEKLCVACDEPIPKGRLKAVPGAQACVPCIEAGLVDDVFKYKSATSQDEMGNFYVNVITEKRDWDVITSEED